MQDVADQTGLNPSHVHEIEVGTRNPRPATLKKLTEGLGISAQFFYLEDSALPVDVLPDMPDELKKFLANGTNIPWLKLAHDAKTRGISPEAMEKIMDIMQSGKK